jgi:hypothetical protein
MSLSFLASDLAKWDVIDHAPKWLVLPFFRDERPLRGAAGLCDWRLCGRLSRLIDSGRMVGEWGESMLYPLNATVAPRLPFAQLLLIGIGDAERFDEEAARRAARLVQEKMAKLGVARYALVPPGR